MTGAPRQARVVVGAPRARWRPTRSVLPLLAAALPVLGAARPLLAQTFPAEVVEVDVAGNSTLAGKDIRRVVRTRGASFLFGAEFDPLLLDEDLRAVRLLYQREGFLAARVDARIDTVSTRRIPYQVAVRFVIEEGPRTFLESVDFGGNTIFTDAQLLGVLQLEPPGPFDPLEAEQDVFRLTGMYLDEGYLRAEVRAVVDTLDAGRLRRLHYRVDEGRRFRVGSFRVEGNQTTREQLIVRELTLEPGDYLRRSRLVKSEQNIYDTGLFTQVDIIPAGVGADSSILDLTVRVREREMRWFAAGIGYGTLDVLRLSGEWGHRNVGGAGRRLELSTLFATGIFPQETQRERLDVGFGQPRVFGTRSIGTINPFYERRREAFLRDNELVGDYRVQSLGVSAGLRREFSRRSRAWLTYTHSFLRLQEPSFTPAAAELDQLGFDEDGTAQDASIAFGRERDTRDRALKPRNGARTRVLGEVTAGRPWGFGRPFGKLTFLRGRYFSLGGGQVLTWRLSTGGVMSLVSDTPVPDRDRFKIGGETTVRGYEDRTLGPGNLMAASSLEWAIPLSDLVSAVLFVDGGGVWGSRADLHPGGFLSLKGTGAVRYATGLGLQWSTPVGPLEVGYGQQIGPPLSAGKGRPYVVLGQAF